MSRPRNEHSWYPADQLRIIAWYRSIRRAALADEHKQRSADLQRFLELHGKEIRSSRLTDWKHGRCRPSKGWLRGLAQISADIASCENLLQRSNGIGKNRLLNLFVVLDIAGSPTDVRLQCIHQMTQVLSPWVPEVQSMGTAQLGWTLPIVENSKIAPEIAIRVNALDPLTYVDCAIAIADQLLAPQLHSRDDDREMSNQLALYWTLDFLCASLLLQRLVTKELSSAESMRLSDSASHAAIVRKMLLSDMPRTTLTNPLSMLKNAKLPFNSNFIKFIATCRKMLEEFLEKYGLGVEAIKVFMR